jgi:hypothetical protein
MNKKQYYISLLTMVASIFVISACKEKSPSTNKPVENQAKQDLKEVKVENWGPQETPERTKFNIQPNGLSAMWVKVKGVSRHPKTHVTFGGKEISGADLAVQDEAVTFMVRDELIQKSGSYEVAIIEGDTGRKILIGNFEVKKN